MLTAEPLDWLIDSNPYVKVVSYTNPTANPNFPTGSYPTQPPCFRAFLPNGVMEEFGCTTDSVQYYVNGAGTKFVDQWRLDMVVDANGNQIHFSYTSITNTEKIYGLTFPIDTELSTITYDSPTCHSTTTMCTGSNWHPQVKIVFNTAQTPTRLTGSSCPTSLNKTTYQGPQTMRCDDAQDLSGSGGLGAPILQSLLILNDVAVQVATNGASPTWETLRDYQFSYEQSASNQNWDDPVTGQLESIAGYLDLTGVQEVGDDNTLTMPPLTMTYQEKDEFYLDNQYVPNPATDCGPSWNTGQGNGCVLWAKATGRYLASLDNGEGWQEVYTFNIARSNTHGGQ